MSKPRITWKEGRWATEGSVGRIPIATVGYGTTRQDTMWYLRTDLPVSSRLIGQHYESKEDAQSAAEKLLIAFISELGGSL